VIPTYKRAQSLARCLDALDHQQRPAEETIVVVRGDDLSSQEVVRARADRVRLVQVHRAGVVAAMNAGIDASGGDVVALTDDDAAPHADWLARIVAAYEEDPLVAAVGGRDRLCIEGEWWNGGSAHVVGTIGRLGLITGNHHMGVGPARDVDVLKGVNLSVRGDLLREVRIDERLRGVGTEHHWELALCLSLRRRGLRVVYDPSIVVDHYPQPRIDDSRQFSPVELRDATHNRTLAVLEHLPRWRQPPYLAWAFAVGTSTEPGVAQTLRALPKRRAGAWSMFRGTQAGLLLAVRTRRRSRRAVR
jgi:GT2 family glycosyltransferase